MSGDKIRIRFSNPKGGVGGYLDAVPCETPGLCVHEALDDTGYNVTLIASGDAVLRTLPDLATAFAAADFLGTLTNWTDLDGVVANKAALRDRVLASPFESYAFAAMSGKNKTHRRINDDVSTGRYLAASSLGGASVDG